MILRARKKARKTHQQQEELTVMLAGAGGVLYTQRPGFSMRGLQPCDMKFLCLLIVTKVTC